MNLMTPPSANDSAHAAAIAAVWAAMDESAESGRPIEVEAAHVPSLRYEDDRDALARYPGRETVPDVRRLAMVGTTKSFPFGRFPDLENIGLTNAGDAHLTELGVLRRLRALMLGMPKVKQLDQLFSIRSLQHVQMMHADALQSLEGVADLPDLRTLHVLGLRALTELPEFGSAAKSLRGLTIRKLSPGPKPVLASLAPLAALSRLRYLMLIVPVADKSLRPLHGLKRLEYLDILPAKYPKEEIAALRAALPGVAGNLHVDPDE